jgi:DNA modification methylase
MLIVADASRLPLRDGCINTVVTSPPYWGLRDYGIAPRIWGAVDCPHVWGDSIQVNATNHTDKRRWNHTRNGRDEEQPTEKRVAWLRTVVDQGAFCGLCGAWRGDLGLEPTPELFTEHIVDVFREVWRVLKDDGTVWLNLGDCYAAERGGTHQPAETLAGGRHGKTVNGERVNRGRADSYNPTRNARGIGLKHKDLVGIPWRAAFALQADGWFLRSDIVWSKPNPMPESVTDRPTKAHEFLFLLAKSERYYYDSDAIKEPLTTDARENYPDRARVTGRGGLPSLEQSGAPHQRSSGGFPPRKSVPWVDSGEGRNKRSVWNVATQPYNGAHFATFPEALVEPCILAGCPLGGLVLDPFIGSGTVGAVAERLGRRWVGTDLGYQPLAVARTAQRGLVW